MAASDLKFKRTIVDKVSVKGVLSEDGTEIYYTDENKDEQRILVSDLISPFKDQPIDMIIALRLEQDLDIIPADDDEQGGE